MPLTPGTRLGAYEIVEQIGAGGMGEVYRAHDPALKRDVAIKIVSAAVDASPDPTPQIAVILNWRALMKGQ